MLHASLLSFLQLMCFHFLANITNLGSHTLTLQVIASDSMTNLPPSSFPKHKIKFTVTGTYDGGPFTTFTEISTEDYLTFTEGDPEKFTVGVLENPLRIASPFQVS
jgi:hypothetical protein